MTDDPNDIGEDNKQEAGVENTESPSKLDELKALFKKKYLPVLHETYRDFRENFKPDILTSILAFILFCIPFGLGVWQIQRLDWKTNLIEQIESRQNQSAYDFTVINPFQDWEALNYRRAFAVGDFMFMHSIKVRPKTLEGKVGYHLLTPLRLKDGGIVIVNRGWVPEGTDITEEYWNSEDINITGILRQSTKPNSFTPENNPKNNEWYWHDLNLIAREIGFDRVAPIILHQDAAEMKEGDAPYPIGGQVNLTLRNAHKIYAATWFLLAFSLILVWFFYSWRSPEITQAPTEGDEGEDNQKSQEDADNT